MTALKFHLSVLATRIRATWISLCDAPRRFRYRRGFIDAMTARYLHDEPASTIRSLRQPEPKHGPCNPYNAGLDQALGLIKRLDSARRQPTDADRERMTRRAKLYDHLRQSKPPWTPTSPL